MLIFRYSITNLFVYHKFLLFQAISFSLVQILAGQHERRFLELICGKKTQVSGSEIFIGVNRNCRCSDLYKLNQVILFSPNYFVRSQCKRIAKIDAIYHLYILSILPRAFVPPSGKATESDLQQSQFRVTCTGSMKGKQFRHILLKFSTKKKVKTMRSFEIINFDYKKKTFKHTTD